MLYILCLFMLVSGYYTLTYGIYIYKIDKNKLGGYAVITAAVIGTLFPIVFLFSR